MKALRAVPVTIVTSLVGALTITSASAMVRLGTTPIAGAPAVRIFDATNPASTTLLNRTQDLGTAGPYVALDELLFTAEGNRLKERNRRANGLPELASWLANGTILSLATGPQRGMVLVLDDQALSLVKFPDAGSVSVLWSYPVLSQGVTAPYGRMVVRDGNFAYVADASLPGVRVLSIDPAAPPTTVAVYRSPAGPVHDLSLWNRTLAILTDTGISLLDAGNSDLPILALRGTFGTPDRPVVSDLNSRWAFVAIGATIVVLDINPASPDFLQGPVDSFTAETPITSLRLDKKNRLYALESGGYEIVDVAPFGGN